MQRALKPKQNLSRPLNSHRLSSVPITKWSKHGATCLFIPGSDPPLDITISMDVSLNPGPSQQPERPLERPQNSYFTSIKVGLLNTRSIVNKLSDFELFIMSNDLDIVLVTESWLSPSINDHEIVPQNFNIFRRDRNRNGGGVFIAAKPSLSPKTVAIFQHESLEIIWIEISTSRRKLLFGCCYRPPSASAQWHDLFQECLNSVLAISQNYLAIYICGDFNIFFTSDEPLQGQPKVLQDSLTALDMDQLINFITRPSPNLYPQTELQSIWFLPIDDEL